VAEYLPVTPCAMKTTKLQTCFAALILSISVSTVAKEVTAIIVSSPSGATISDNGQAKPKVLGKAPLRVTIEVGSIDYQRGVLQADRYSAKWPSGAISKVLTYTTPVSETEFVYFVERPLGVAGDTKDKTAGDAHNRKPDVAAENQLIVAKVRAWNEQVANYKKQKELETQAEEMRRERAAAEARQQAQQQAANEATARRAKELKARQLKDEERAAQNERYYMAACMPTWVQGRGMVTGPECQAAAELLNRDR
jgi:hypothetical protein